MTDPKTPSKPLGPVARRIPPGEDRERLVCESCGFINYVNPKIVVGAVALWEDRIPRISQVQMIYRARLLSPDVSAGPESREVGLFAWDDIPWDHLAFPSVLWALGHWRETRDLPAFPPFGEPPEGL